MRCLATVSSLIALLIGAGTVVTPLAAQAQMPPSPKRLGGQHWSLAMQVQQPRAQGVMQLQPETKPWHVHDALIEREQDTARLTIEFKPRSATADLRDLGTVRVQLSSQGSFSLRPRRGGVQMSWKSTF